MPAVSLIQLPYDSGRFEERMGRGPGALLQAGLPELLRDGDCEVTIESILLDEGFQTEGNALLDLQRRCTPIVRDRIRTGAFPILLSGNCAPAALSAVSALGAAATGVVWFDAHGDFNTPETSPSGFLDGMAMALLTGRCWPNLLARLDAFAPIPPTSIIQVGVRDTDPAEETMLATSGVIRIIANDVSGVGEAVERLGASQLYVHVDADVLDTTEGYANTFARPAGLRLDELREALTQICRTGRVTVASVTAYDPAADGDGRIRRALCDIIAHLGAGQFAA